MFTSKLEKGDKWSIIRSQYRINLAPLEYMISRFMALALRGCWFFCQINPAFPAITSFGVVLKTAYITDIFHDSMRAIQVKKRYGVIDGMNQQRIIPAPCRSSGVVP